MGEVTKTEGSCPRRRAPWTDSPVEPGDGIEEVVEATPPPRRQAREIRRLLEVERIRRLVDRWKDICAIFKVQGRASKDHAHWKECGSGAADKAAMEGALTTLECMKFESFSGCDYCRPGMGTAMIS
jgi:hypothetical protein